MSQTRDRLGERYEADQLTPVGSDPQGLALDEAEVIDRGDAPAAGAASAPSAGSVQPTRRVVRLVSTTPGTDLSIELQAGVNRVGRQRAGNHIVLVSPQVSRWHAELEVLPERVLLRDLGSANGTYVNGERAQERELVAGDLVAFSDKFTLRVLVELQPETLRFPAAAVEATAAARSAPTPSPTPAAPPADGHRATPTTPIDPAARRIPTAELGAPNTVPLSSSGALLAPAVGVEPLPSPALAAAPPARRRPTKPLTAAQAGSLLGALATDPAQPIDPLAPDISPSERDHRQLALLYQIARGCLLQTSLAELDALLIRTLEQGTGFSQAFIGYQLPTRDWKLVVSRGGEDWDPELLRRLLQRGLQARPLVMIDDSLRDPSLGQRADGQPDQRALLPLWAPREPLGAACVVTPPGPPDPSRSAYLTLFAELAALALRQALRRERDG